MFKNLFSRKKSPVIISTTVMVLAENTPYKMKITKPVFDDQEGYDNLGPMNLLVLAFAEEITTLKKEIQDLKEKGTTGL